LFLLTGIGLALQTPSVSVGTWFWVKLIAVFASIPLAVIGFRKANKGMALLSLLLILYAWGVSETRSPRMKKSDYFGSLGPAEALVGVNTDRFSEKYDSVVHGKALYATYCVTCHGPDGALGVAGAKNLAHSTLDRDATKDFIRKGKNAMPGFGSDVLTEDELDALVAFLKVEMAAQPHPH
jgi:mono/diheme cytochrome c family protein